MKQTQSKKTIQDDLSNAEMHPGTHLETDEMVENQSFESEELSELEQLQQDYESVVTQLADAKRREQLALADYQNLMRRTNQERGKIARLAARTFVEDLLQPLSHLALASEQINDAGLTMVVSQLWIALENNGLKKIEALGKKFDVTTMEATEVKDKGEKVTKVVSDGYLLNDEVIQHAKVILD